MTLLITLWLQCTILLIQKKTNLTLREKAMAKWYNGSVNPNSLCLSKQLVKYLNFACIETKVILLLQFVMDKFLNHGLKFRNILLESNDETQVAMDNQIQEPDEEIFRYLAGYVLYSLKIFIKNSDPYLKKQRQELLAFGVKKSTWSVVTAYCFWSMHGTGGESWGTNLCTR